MSFSRGDVIWLRVDNLEGGVGKLHPAIIISSNAFNDSHTWGIIVRGTSQLPNEIEADQLLIRPNAENGLDRDTVFLPIVQSTLWTRVLKLVGKVPPYQLRQLMERVRVILEL